MDAATFPTPSVISALLAVIVAVAIEEADPVIEGPFASSCVWMFEVALFKYPSSADVTSDIATVPSVLVISALLPESTSRAIVLAEPVIEACFAFS